MSYTYVRIPESRVPEHVEFHTPQFYQGQYSQTAYGFARIRGRRFGEWVTPQGEAGFGERYMRETDLSLPEGHPDRVRYFIRRPER